MHFFVGLLGVLSDSFLEFSLVLPAILVFSLLILVLFVHLVVQNLLDSKHLCLVQREELPFPFPFQLSFAVVLVVVPHAASADTVVHNGDGLEAVCEDNVGVHSSNIHVVDQRVLEMFGWGFDITQELQLLKDLPSHFVVV